MKTKCQFISIENIWNGDIQITIPDIQRGLVWNAAQIEVFWDSLLRGIPIGLFSVTESAGELILLDGQQRWHAINAAKATEPNEHGVLWCAILDDPSQLNIYNRKYLLRWTTQAHPWGFGWEENERGAQRLKLDERREILINNGRTEEDLFKKPQVGEIIPYPYSKVKVVKIQTILNEEPPEDFSDSEKRYWLDLQAKIQEVIRQPIIPLMGNISFMPRQETSAKPDQMREIGSGIDPDWTETFFLRMNSQGTPFSQNELAYSSLKSSLHAIGIESPRSLFEETAKKLQISDTASLAQIMLQLITFSLYGENVYRTWNAGMIKDFFKDKSGDKEKIISEIESLKIAADDLQTLIGKFNARQRRIQILPYHLSQMPFEIVRLALLILKSRPVNRDVVSEKLLSLMFLLWWFCVEERVNGVKAPIFHATRHIVEEIQKNGNISPEQLFAHCVHEGFHVPPITPEMLKDCNGTYGIDANPVRSELLELRKGNTFYWNISKNFVLLACGKYLKNNFSDVRAGGEDIRPWDYDHFLPKSKAEDAGSTLMSLCCSSGNNVPIALTTNRAKQDSLPDKHYPDNTRISQDLLYLDLESLDEILPGGETVDPDKFCGFAWQRYCRMYEEVYAALGWDSFVHATYRDGKGFAGIANALVERINAATGRTYNWYYALDGRDFPVLDDEDFGRYQFYVLRDSEETCYAIETQDFRTFSTYGKRKAVIQAIGRGVSWWDDSDNLEGLPAQKALAWLKEKSYTTK